MLGYGLYKPGPEVIGFFPGNAVHGNRCRQACNWPRPDRMTRNRRRRQDEGAGRMTATARADIGARYLKPDDKHGSRVAYSFVMTSPSAAISIGSLLSFRTLGVRPAETEGFDMATKRRKKTEICRCCIPMPPESVWAPVNYSSQFPRTAIQNQCVVTRHLPEIPTSLPIGSRAAAFALWRWSPPACTGFRCTRSWRPAVSKFSWSMQITSRTFLAERATSPIANGSNISTRWACCGPAFVPQE